MVFFMSGQILEILEVPILRLILWTKPNTLKYKHINAKRCVDKR